MQSVGTLFAQNVAGYLGSSAERRGKNAEQEAVFSLVELQDLLDEWIVTGWQNRAHEGLRDPLSPGQVLTPNEKYAAMLGVAGYVPVPLSGDDYIELLPMKPRAINSYASRSTTKHVTETVGRVITLYATVQEIPPDHKVATPSIATRSSSRTH